MALDQFVNQVQTLSGEGKFHELYEHLTKSQEVLVRNPGLLDNVLDSLDMQQHSMGYMAVLTAKIHHIDNNWDDLLQKVDTFVSQCNGEQVRYAAHSFAEMCHLMTQELINRGTAQRGIGLMTRAIRKIQLTETSLTTIHADLCKLCLIAKCFPPALAFLNTDINQINKENNQFDASYLLLYYYYGGCIYTAVKQFERAFYFFEVAVTCPTAAVSHIMLESYKKYQLVGLLVHGDKPRDVVALPKFTSPLVTKFLKPLCGGYNDLVTAYHSNNAEELRAAVTKYQELLTTDNNLGLVQQVVESQTRTNIKRLTKTFVTLSLQDVASRVQLESPQEAEKAIVEMIAAGTIHATISQQDGMVKFDSNPESYSSPAMLRFLEENVDTGMLLDKKVHALEEELMVSPAYIKKLSGGRGEEEEGGGVRVPSSSNTVSSVSGKLPGYSM